MSHRDWLTRNRNVPGVFAEGLATRLSLLYKRQRNKVTALIRNARRDFVDRMIREASGDQSRLWRVVRYVMKNELGSGRTRLPSQLSLDGGVMIQDPDLIASEMNRYFVEVAGDLRARLLEDYSNRPRSFTLSREVDRSA